MNAPGGEMRAAVSRRPRFEARSKGVGSGVKIRRTVCANLRREHRFEHQTCFTQRMRFKRKVCAFLIDSRCEYDKMMTNKTTYGGNSSS